jgi:hypothetical protein
MTVLIIVLFLLVFIIAGLALSLHGAISLFRGR